jgi:type III restriction enzyme
MTIHHVNTISNRLSLRAPQRDSLEILNRICEISPLKKEIDAESILKTIQSEFSHVESFDRDFPSLCFALATGVGKTRLMGAFISYLHISENIRHFMVLAPNLTIYKKLIADFTPNTPKYVFKGIGEFAQNKPLIITGDDYESGRGVRGDKLFVENIDIYIFNFAMSTAKDKGKLSKDDERTKLPRIRRFREYIGESYFEYLAVLDDMVILMDESHRYRANAGLNAINDLKPILGLELTATPQVEKGQGTETFNNVIYSYPLSAAMEDGFVKEPAVATRENFNAANYSDDGLEKIKLEDGIRIHENTKAELIVYAGEYDQTPVKPFMLLVAQDTTHANALQQLIENDDFFEGRYAGKVITVHSNVRGDEKDEVVEQLLTVEDPKNPIEIVIHVNMLKEGWDVTNLYTILPLRAANSKTLVEQSIGRGLRLPYGKRVGVPAVDRLTIVSHDKFQEIIDHANDPDSIIRTGIVIGRDIPEAGKKAVVVDSAFNSMIGKKPLIQQTLDTALFIKPKEKLSLFDNKDAQKIATATFNVIRKYEHLKSSSQLLNKDIQEKIITEVRQEVAPYQKELDFGDKVDVADVVNKTTELYEQFSIDIPKIILLPKGEYSCGYEYFTVDTSKINLQSVSQEILIQHLHDHNRFKLMDGSGIVDEKRPEDYIIRGLIVFDDISYDEHATLLYDLAGQVVTHLKSYLSNNEDLINVLQYHQQTIVHIIHDQMQEHFVESVVSYEAHVTKGFHALRQANYTADSDEKIRNFRISIPEGQLKKIPSMLFGGFEKCLYPIQKFDSDPERRFAVILEDDDDVLKWFKPSKGDFKIDYNRSNSYSPDFVVETKTCKHLCEPKRSSEMNDKTVLAKADAAAIWCKNASDHASEYDGKEWKYLLIPHDKIADQMTLSGLEAGFLYSTKQEYLNEHE